LPGAAPVGAVVVGPAPAKVAAGARSGPPPGFGPVPAKVAAGGRGGPLPAIGGAPVVPGAGGVLHP
jgi:hypothetical protein